MTRADVWLAQDSPDPDVLVIGVPWSEGSRCDLAPMAMRDRLHRFSTSEEEWGVDFSGVRVRDEGNWAVSELDGEAMAHRVAELVSDLPDGPLRIFVGGSPSIPMAGDTGSHVNVDLAKLDRVFAPGAPQAKPGGLSIKELGSAVRANAASPSVVSFGFTGVDPTRDRDNLTADAMAFLILTVVAGYAERT